MSEKLEALWTVDKATSTERRVIVFRNRSAARTWLKAQHKSIRTHFSGPHRATWGPGAA